MFTCLYFPKFSLCSRHLFTCNLHGLDLARFQVSVLLKAMSFPHVTRVVYSTCSIHDEENELVVAEVLQQFNQSALEGGPTYSLRKCLPSWPRRGREVGGLSAEQAACVVRADPLLDDTHGFFVAHFERSDSESISIPPAAEEQTAVSASSKKNMKKREKRRLKRIKMRQENPSAAHDGVGEEDDE